MGTRAAALIAGALIAGCAGAGTTTSTELPIPAGLGVLTGGVDPCLGLPPAPGGLTYAAASVTASRGVVTWVTTGPGTLQPVFPSSVAARQDVGPDGMYRFTLAPGRYVLRARFAAGNVEPFIGGTVTAGVVTRIDIPNECK